METIKCRNCGNKGHKLRNCKYKSINSLERLGKVTFETATFSTVYTLSACALHDSSL